jgi:hypothetical protein
MPVLAFGRRYRNEGFFVSNVGKGPAMNIVVAQGRAHHRDSIRLSKRGGSEEWFSPIHLTPIPPGESVHVPWDAGKDLGMYYTDIFAKRYSVKATSDGMRLFEGVRLPRWKMPDTKWFEDLEEVSAAERWAIRST